MIDQLKQYYNPSPEKVFFTSDTHFFHKNILEFCQRPWQNVTDMGEALVENWNRVVPEDGIVFHLGDFGLGGTQKDWIELRKRLHGKIILVRGNHDFKENSQNKEFLESVFDYVTYQFRATIDGYRVFMSHFPPLCFSGSWSNSLSLFGHIHTCSVREKNSGLDFDRSRFLMPSQYDVGTDFNRYTPVPWSEVKEKIEFQKKNNVNMLIWLDHDLGNITKFDLFKYRCKVWINDKIFQKA